MTNTIYIHQPEKAFSFTRLPNFLFEAPTFKPLSNEAKVLYALSCAGQSYPARMGGRMTADGFSCITLSVKWSHCSIVGGRKR